MKVIYKLILPIGLALLVTACSRGDALEIPAGSEVTVQTQDGVEIRGRLIEVEAGQIVLESAGGRTRVPRAEIRTISAGSAAPALDGERAGNPDGGHDEAAGMTGTGPGSDGSGESRNPLARIFDREPRYREMTIPAGTLLPVALQSTVASDSSRADDPVQATLRRPVTIGGVEVLPAGTTLHGHVTNAAQSARVKGRAAVGLRFTRIDAPHDGRTSISSTTISRIAPATKKQDAATIGAGAAGGAIVGGVLGGGEGAAKGAAVGGAAGTGVVLSTRGKQVRLAPGTPLSVRLTAPLTVRVIRREEG